MNKKDEALKLALNLIEWLRDEEGLFFHEEEDAIREALADHIRDATKMIEQSAQQETVAVYVGETWCGSVVRLYEDLPLETPLYTSPQPSKPWVGLTEEQHTVIFANNLSVESAIHATEKQLKENNK